MRPVSPASAAPPPLAVSRTPSTIHDDRGDRRGPGPAPRRPRQRACQAPAKVPPAAPRSLSSDDQHEQCGVLGKRVEPAAGHA